MYRVYLVVVVVYYNSQALSLSLSLSVSHKLWFTQRSRKSQDLLQPKLIDINPCNCFSNMPIVIDFFAGEFVTVTLCAVGGEGFKTLKAGRRATTISLTNSPVMWPR